MKQFWRLFLFVFYVFLLTLKIPFPLFFDENDPFWYIFCHFMERDPKNSQKVRTGRSVGRSGRPFFCPDIAGLRSVSLRLQ